MDTKFDSLIIGGGMTAAAAALGIREVDPKGTIGIISGGFIGSEIRAAFAYIGEKVVMAFPENGI